MDEPEQIAAFLWSIRREMAAKHRDALLVDLVPLIRVTPAAALALLAEMFRVTALFPNVQLKIKRPAAKEADSLLFQIGYYDYSDARKAEVSVDGTRSYWKHRRGTGVQQLAAKDLIEFMSSSAVPQPALLYEALVEGMQNTSEHAYERVKDNYRSWWLLGYHEPTKHEIAFCFYDQGAGIPATIRTRLKDRLPLISKSGSALIRKAVVEGHYSKTQEKRRGRGLPTLKRFIDGAPSGELVIFSRESRCIFRAGGETHCDDFDTVLHGTLISWTLQVE